MAYISKEEMMINFISPVCKSIINKGQYTSVINSITAGKDISNLTMDELKDLVHIISEVENTFKQYVSKIMKNTNYAVALIRKAVEEPKQVTENHLFDKNINIVENRNIKKKRRSPKFTGERTKHDIIDMVVTNNEKEYNNFLVKMSCNNPADIFRIRITCPRQNKRYEKVPCGYFICPSSLSKKEKEKIKFDARYTYSQSIKDKYWKEIEEFHKLYKRYYEACINPININRKSRYNID